MWNTLQHQTCEMLISFFHSLQNTHIVLFNDFLSFFKYFHQLLNSSSTNPPPFLAWLTGHLHLRYLSTFASFCWVQCHHSKVGGAYNLVIWVGYPLISDSGRTSYSPTEVPIYFPRVLQDFWNFHSWSLHHSSFFMYHPPPAPFNSCFTYYLDSYRFSVWIVTRSFYPFTPCRYTIKCYYYTLYFYKMVCFTSHHQVILSFV